MTMNLVSRSAIAQPFVDLKAQEATNDRKGIGVWRGQWRDMESTSSHVRFTPVKALMDHQCRASSTTIPLPRFPSDRKKQGLEPQNASPLVRFPLIKTKDYVYDPCTIPIRSPSDPPQATPAETLWIQLFRNSIDIFKKKAELDDSVPDAPAKAAKFAERYGEILDELLVNAESNGGPPNAIEFCRLRENCLRELGFTDIYKTVKAEENEKCIALLDEVMLSADNIQDLGERIEHLVKGVFAGNVFDLGACQLAERFDAKACSFQESVDELLPRPWVIDDLDTFKEKWLRQPWKKAVVFCDNAGPDVVLGVLPFARELLRSGTEVILAANNMPSVNDITYEELKDIISKITKVENGQETIFGVDSQHLRVMNSGSDLPVIDLSHISQELANAAQDADLVVLEGMGRSIETNLFAEFQCDAAKMGMVKHSMVAEFLGGRLYDCVIKFTDSEASP